MLCCWIENPNSDAFKHHLARVADFLWVGEDGMKVRVKFTCLITPVSSYASRAKLIFVHKLILHVIVHSKVCAGQLWDVAFAVQAILACNNAEEFGSTLKKSHNFIKASQVLVSRTEFFSLVFILN
jgi:cycloartenol synthase